MILHTVTPVFIKEKCDADVKAAAKTEVKAVLTNNKTPGFAGGYLCFSYTYLAAEKRFALTRVEFYDKLTVVVYSLCNGFILPVGSQNAHTLTDNKASATVFVYVILCGFERLHKPFCKLCQKKIFWSMVQKR